MIYNTVEQDASEAITEYKEKPTWGETLSAATKNFKAASLSTSEFNYYNDERKAQMAEWKKNDPANTLLYDNIGELPKQVVEKLESMYEDNNIEGIRNWNSMGTGDYFLKFKDIQKEKGIVGPKDIIEIAKNKSFQDYEESSRVLSESDYLSAKLLGTMGGALQDPVTLATLPMGTWKSGTSIMMTAARAFGEEALIETAAQAVILPTTYAYKQEIGIRTTLKDEAYNAVASIATAGLIRGTGSAAFDLTAKGIKALKAKDPQLGTEYERMANSQATDSMDEHINNIHKAEFNEEAEITISNPNEVGAELSKAKPIPEANVEVVAAARGEKISPEYLDAEVVQRYISAKDEIQAEAAEALDKQLHNVEGDYEGPAIRGMLDTEGTLGKLKVGDSYTTRGATSIAKDKATADTFVKRAWEEGAKGEKIYVTFESFINKPVNLGVGNKLGFDDMLFPTGAKHSFIEDEVVIPSGRNFEVVSKVKKDGETHLTVREVEAPTEIKPDPRELKIYSGEDEAGNPVYKSHRELAEEVDNDAMWIQKAKECFL